MNLRITMPSFWKRLKGDGIGAVLVRGASGSLAVSVLGATMAFGVNVLLARLMGVTQYGIYIYALTWINLLALLCQLGMHTSLLRFVSSYKANEEWGLLQGLLRSSVKYVLFASIISGALATIVVWFLQEYVGIEKAKTFWIAVLLLPFLSLTGLRSATLRAFRHVIKAGLPESFFRPLLILILSVGFYLYSQQDLLATQVMFFNLFGALTAFYIGTVWLIKAMPENIRDISPIYEKKTWLKVSLPLFFISGMNRLYMQADILMVGAILGTREAGIYAIASRISGLVAFGFVAVNAIAAPMISELYSLGKLKDLQRMMILAARGVFVFAVAVSMCLAFFGKNLLGFFGYEFISGYVPLLILLVAHTINAFLGSGGFLMVMTGYQNQHAKYLAVIVIVSIIANAFLIPKLGINGAAISVMISTALWNIILLAFVWRRLKINPTILSMVPK